MSGSCHEVACNNGQRGVPLEVLSEGDCEGSLGAGEGFGEGVVSVSGDSVLQAYGFVAISQEPSNSCLQ